MGWRISNIVRPFTLNTIKVIFNHEINIGLTNKILIWRDFLICRLQLKDIQMKL